MSVIFLAYTSNSIATTFYITAGTFAAMSFYGYTTKRDLTSIGNMAFMALIGIIIASVVNMFLQNEMMYWIISYLGVAIFVGLIAYDTQKLKEIGSRGFVNEDNMEKTSIMGALSLYLDFAELQATNGRLMKMYDWVKKLDDFLQISEKEILTNAGKTSHKKAIDKAKAEYEKYRKEASNKHISDFDREMKKLLKNGK
jgi:hypothetical protein